MGNFDTIALIVGALIVAVTAVGKFLAAKKKTTTETTERRRKAVRLAAWCETAGLQNVAELLQAYAAGDVSRMIQEFHDIADTIADAELSKSALFDLISGQIGKLLDDDDGREKVAQTLEEKLGVEVDRKAITPVKKPAIKKS